MSGAGIGGCIEVRPVCPFCGGIKLENEGAYGNVTYRVCRECGKRVKVVRVRGDEVEVLRKE